MPLELVTIPCLTDNYAYLIRDTATGETALVDVPESAPILAELALRGWRLDKIFLTHHHHDHVQGTEDLVKATGAVVYGAQADAHRLPPLTRALREGDEVTVGQTIGGVLDVSGHTLGHIAFVFPSAHLAFTADSLMAGGCGRLFEGSPAVMWASLSKLAALPAQTMICSGHEYTASNLRFAATIEPENPALLDRIAQVAAARVAGVPTVPSLLSLELATNPFLRANLPHIKASLGLSGASDADVFAAIRALKDKF
jgi:hydroxyacylglutathione hydrolase